MFIRVVESSVVDSVLPELASSVSTWRGGVVAVLVRAAAQSSLGLETKTSQQEPVPLTFTHFNRFRWRRNLPA